MDIDNQYLKQIMPTELSFEELHDPLKTIARIFDNTRLETLKIELWEMLKSCSRAQCWSYQSDPSLALDCQRLMNDLTDGLFLILKKHEAEFGEVPYSKALTFSSEQDEIELEFLKSTYVVLNTFKGRIRRLSVDELERPHLALKKFFGIKSPALWKSTLNEWVNFALGKVSMLEVFEDKDTLWDFEQFERLIETAYLINLKEERNYMQQEYAIEAAIREQYFGACGVGYSSKLESVIIDFLKKVPASRLNHNLKNALLYSLIYHKKALPVNIEKLLEDILSIVELLEAVEEEQRQLKIKL